MYNPAELVVAVAVPVLISFNFVVEVISLLIFFIISFFSLLLSAVVDLSQLIPVVKLIIAMSQDIECEFKSSWILFLVHVADLKTVTNSKNQNVAIKCNYKSKENGVKI